MEAPDVELFKSKSETVGSSVFADDIVGASVGMFVGESAACDGSNVGDSDRVGATEGFREGLLLGAITGCMVGASVFRNSASQETPP